VIFITFLLLLALAAPAAAATDELPQRLDGCAATQERPAPPPAFAAAGPSVRATVREAAEKGLVTPEAAAEYETQYERALAARGRLPVGRRAELSAVVRALEGFARGRMLTVSRMPVLFEQLRRNTDWWSRSGPPVRPAPPGASTPCAGGNGTRTDRVVIGEVVYQWYAGQGLQLQQLATAGRANALAKACTEPEPKGFKCRPERLRTALDSLVSLAVERGDFLAWEYYFGFGGGRPPWISGLAQGTAMQALVRGSKHFGDPRYLEVARRALGAFSTRAPRGVRVAAEAGDHFLIYSFNPRLRVLNGFLQALVGLYDYAEAAGDDEARALFASGERQARVEVPRHDTGAWSLYSATTGAESDLGYHRLVRDFLRSLCERTKAEPYCGTERRFTGYLYQRPRLSFTGGQQPGTAKFFLSKISCVTLKVSRHGRPVATVARVLGRGSKALGWRPPGRGRYVVRVEAQDLMGRRAAIRTTVRAR
jgi:hypothetical protein